MLPSVTLTSPLLGTPPRVNPFSLRQDLNGGRCKLLDTPSKSVISLTFTLPALQDPCSSPHLLRGMPGTRALPRRCQSLPCTPEFSRTLPLLRYTERKEEGEEEDVRSALRRGTVEDVEDDIREDIEGSERTGESLHVELMDITEKRELVKDEHRTGEDAGLPVELEMLSLARLEEVEEEEGVCPTEPMDCTKSPEPADGGMECSPSRPLLISSSLQTNGWRLPNSNGPPSSPAPPPLDNGSALVIGQQVQWGGGGRANGYSEAQNSEQDEVISCPGCCLVGLSFPFVCLRGSAAVPAPRRRASLPRQRPYRNLNVTITGSAPSTTASTATKALLCRSTNGLAVGGPSVSCGPGRSLPEAQS